MKTIDQIILEENQKVLAEELPHLLEFDPAIVIAGAIGGYLGVYLHKFRSDKILKAGKAKCMKMEGIKKQKCLQDYNKVYAERLMKTLYQAKAGCKVKFRGNPEVIKKCQDAIEVKLQKQREIVKKNKRNFGVFQPSGFV